MKKGQKFYLNHQNLYYYLSEFQIKIKDLILTKKY